MTRGESTRGIIVTAWEAEVEELARTRKAKGAHDQAIEGPITFTFSREGELLDDAPELGEDGSLLHEMAAQAFLVAFPDADPVAVAARRRDALGLRPI